MMKKRFYKGAASFYIVAFSTLILVIIAASFATVVISEVARASNDDLSQSAYDAALAGVEDAKLAYSNYRRCLAKGYTAVDPRTDGNSEVTCGNIIWWMEHADCDMVALILGRVSKTDWVNSQTAGGSFDGEVLVSDTSTTNGLDGATSNLNQAYTCVKINTVLPDYRANLTSNTQTKMVKVELSDPNAINSINAIKFSWYDVRKGEVLNWGNFIDNRVAFQPVMNAEVATPPTVSLQMIQTANSFNLSDFEVAVGDKTNRATLYFVPTDKINMADKTNEKTTKAEEALASGGLTDATFLGIYDRNNGKNRVSVEQVVKTNNHYTKNLPFLTYCPDTENVSDFYCSVVIDLPTPVGDGSRNASTFLFFVNLPYGEPDTNFAIEFLGNSGETEYVKGVQIEIDSTGRANDLYRRVETRLEATDTSFPYPYYAVQMLDGNAGDGTIIKNMTVTCEAGITNCSY